jgi:dihydroxyacid dehydratase/phosphogluconate dehydratase
MAMARHAGVELKTGDWMEYGHNVPLLLNMQPAGKFLGERFHRAGGVPAIMWELEQQGLLRSNRADGDRRHHERQPQGPRDQRPRGDLPVRRAAQGRRRLLRPEGQPVRLRDHEDQRDFAAFRARYLSKPGNENIFECRAIVFDGSDDYHARINDPALNIDEDCMLVIRGAGPVGWPGSAEVVNMQPPDALIKRGINSLPTLGDGRQSGTSDSPSILNASPESAVGGGLAWLRTGDRIRVDLNAGQLRHAGQRRGAGDAAKATAFRRCRPARRRGRRSTAPPSARWKRAPAWNWLCLTGMWRSLTGSRMHNH